MKKRAKYDWTWVTWRDLEHGIKQYECYIKSSLVPVGIVWGTALMMGKGKVLFVVLDSLVDAMHRRCGVRSAIQTELEKHYDSVMTFTATKSSDPWMRSQKYDKLRAWGLWIKDNKMAARKKSKRKK